MLRACVANRAPLLAQVKTLESQGKYYEAVELAKACSMDPEINAAIAKSRQKLVQITFGTTPTLLKAKYPDARCVQLPNPEVTRCLVPATSSDSGSVESYLYHSNQLINLNGVGSKTPAPHTADTPSQAKWACREAIRAALAAPSTAKFPNHNEFSFRPNAGGYDVTGHVDAQNSFGAMLRSQFTCSLEKIGDEWRVISVKTVP